MNDERISELLAGHPGPASVDADFEDRLFSILQGEMRRRQSPRLVLLLAAALTIVALLGAAAVGSGLVRLPSLDLSLVPQPTAMPTEVPTTTQAGQMLGSHFGHTASLLPDGRVLVAGGFEDLKAEIYDPDTGTWTATAPMVAMRDGHTATVLADGNVLVVGGADTDMRPAHTSAEIYDPRADTWTATGSMVSPRAHHTANLLPDGRVLIAGGEDHVTGGAKHASVEIYDPATGQWSDAGDMNVPRGRHTATLLQSGLLLVAGGTVEASASAELYDPAQETWTPTGSMIVNREGHSAVLLPDGRVFVVGGMGILGPRTTTNTSRGELYDPATGSWDWFFQPSDGAFSAVAVLPDRTVLASDAASVDIWDPATSRWTPAPALSSTRNWFAYSATVLDDGTVLMAGGWELSDAGVGPPSLFERYAPPAPAAASVPIDTEDWVPFTSDRYGYTVAHPPSWTATPATRTWDFEIGQRWAASQSEGADQFGGSSAYVLSSAGYLIWFTAFAVDVPAGTSEDRWMADYYAGGPWMGPRCYEYADAAQRPITVDGQRGTMIIGDTGCGASAFVFVDGRVHVFGLEAHDRPAGKPEWQPLRTALLEAFLGTVEFRP